MRAIAFHRNAQHARAQIFEPLVVLTERFELDRSNTAEIEQVPGQHHGSASQVLRQIDRLAG